MNPSRRHLVSGKAPGQDRKTVDPIRVLLEGWKPVLFIGSCIFFALAVVAYLRQKPYYETHGQMRISPVIPAFLRPMEDLSITGYYHDHLRTELERLQQSSLLEKMLELNPDYLKFVGGLPHDENDRAIWYQNHVEVRQVPRTQLLEIKVKGGGPDHLHTLTNHLLDTYIEISREEEEFKDRRRLQYLLDVKSDLSEKRTAVQTKLEKIARELGTGTFEQGFWVKRETLAESQKALARTLADLVSSNARLTRVEKENSSELDLDISGRIMDRLSRDDSLWNTEFWTYRQLQNLRSSVDGITPENPDRKYIDQRMENMQEYLNGVTSDAKRQAEEIEDKLRHLKAEERSIDALETLDEKVNLAEQLWEINEELESEARTSASNIVIARTWQMELEHVTEMEFRLNERIHELKLDAKAPDRVNVIKYAKEPEHPAGSNLKKMVMVSGAFSFGSIGLVIYILALGDSKIRRPEHIEMACGTLPSWPISRVESYQDFGALVKDGIEHPSTRALRSLAFRILRNKEGTGILTTAFVGADSGVGTSSISLNVGQTLANTGSRVVILSDKTREVQEEWIPVDEHTCPDGYQAYQDKGNNIIYLWPKPDCYLNMDKLKIQLSNKVDIILVDCEPLLMSDVTEALAGGSEMVVLVSQGDSTRFDLLRRSFTILWRMGCEEVIPVLNWGGREEES